MPPDNPSTSGLLAQMEAAVRRSVHGVAQDKVFVAFSGGLDSTLLLLIVQRLLSEQGQTPVALHAQHNLHPEAAVWTKHCQGLCDRLAIPIVHRSLAIQSGNTEAQARRARYGFFAEQLPTDGVVLFAHHASDQSETILQRMFTGRGVLPMRATGRCGEGCLVRPLLAFDKSQLASTLGEHWPDVAWLEDPSNADTSLDRNFVRHQVLPRVEQRWPGLHSRMRRIAQVQWGQQQALAQTLEKLQQTDGPDTWVSLGYLPRSQDAALAWLRALAQLYAGFSCSDRSALAFWHDLGADDPGTHSQCFEGATHQQCVLRINEHYEMRTFNDRLYLLSLVSTATPNLPLTAGQLVPCQYGQLSVQAADVDDPAGFYAAAPNLRPRAGGEVVVIDGRRVSLKTLLHDEGVPPWRRVQHPLVYDGEQIVCVPGIWQRAPAESDSGPYLKVHWC